MIETPAAAINADILAREVDFFSIGTNDLTQYILACDRTNQNLSYLYHTQNRAVIRTIKHVIDAAHAEGKWVAVCGELENPEVLKILLGLGVDEFSMVAPRIPYAKEFIRQLKMSEALAHANRLT